MCVYKFKESKGNFFFLNIGLQVFLEKFIKIVYFNVLFRNHGNLSSFKFGQNLCFFVVKSVSPKIMNV